MDLDFDACFLTGDTVCALGVVLVLLDDASGSGEDDADTLSATTISFSLGFGTDPASTAFSRILGMVGGSRSALDATRDRSLGACVVSLLRALLVAVVD